MNTELPLTLTPIEDSLITLNLALANAGFGTTDRDNYQVIVETLIADEPENVGIEICKTFTDIASGKLGESQCSKLIEHVNTYFVATAGMMQINSKKLRFLISETLVGNTAFLILFMNAASLKLGLVG
jgi:hypothetical protein